MILIRGWDDDDQNFEFHTCVTLEAKVFHQLIIGMRARKKPESQLHYSARQRIMRSSILSSSGKKKRRESKEENWVDNPAPNIHPEYYEKLIEIQEMYSYYASRNW